MTSDGVNGRITLHAHENRQRRPMIYGERPGVSRAQGWLIVASRLALGACLWTVPVSIAAAKPEAADSDPAKAEQSKARDAAKPDAAKRTDAPAGAKAAGKSGPAAEKPADSAPKLRFDIDEFRIEGADSMPQIEVEEAVYPFLGPGRTSDDVEKARAAVEKAYHDKGFQTVGVSVPQQDAQRGFIVLKVAENRVGRLRVKGSRYFDLANIKQKAPSLQEGNLPDFKAVTKDIVGLNQWPDRRVTPALRAGVTPGTVDVDLNVEDTIPLHASIELNNRQSPSTTPLRLSTTVHYDNLWQLGHSLTATYQVAPLNSNDAMVFSGSYLARTELEWLNVMVYGLKSYSNVATVGGANVVGPGQVIGSRAVITLPTRGELFHTLSLGADYKNFEQTLSLGSSSFSSPVTYVPLVASYSATFQAEGRLTQFNAALTAGLRGIGSSPDDFHAKRAGATENFIHLTGDVSHTHDLPGGVQLFGKVQGQVADQPLVSSEQISFGGQDTVRGYLESEVLADFGVAGTFEVRSPNIAPFFEQKLENPTGEPFKFNAVNDWRFFAFADAGRGWIHEQLAEQQNRFDLASYGVGTRMKALQYFNTIVFVGMPLTSQQVTRAYSPRVSFRVWGEF